VPELVISTAQLSRSCTLCSNSETGASRSTQDSLKVAGHDSLHRPITNKFAEHSTFLNALCEVENSASIFISEAHEFLDKQPTQLPMCLRNIILQHVQNAETFPEGSFEEASLKKRMSKYFVVPADPSDPAAFTETFPGKIFLY